MRKWLIWGCVVLVMCSITLVACKNGSDPTGPSYGPFTGTFQRDASGTFESGGTWTGTNAMIITQEGTTITGTFKYFRTSDCCTMEFSVPLNGVADEKNAAITLGTGEGSCSGANECGMRFWRDTVTPFDITMSDDGNTIQFGSSSYSKM